MSKTSSRSRPIRMRVSLSKLRLRHDACDHDTFRSGRQIPVLLDVFVVENSAAVETPLHATRVLYKRTCSNYPKLPSTAEVEYKISQDFTKTYILRYAMESPCMDHDSRHRPALSLFVQPDSLILPILLSWKKQVSSARRAQRDSAARIH